MLKFIVIKLLFRFLVKKAQGQLRNLKRPGWNICYCIISKRVATRVLPQSRKGSFAVTMMKLDLMASVMTGSGKTVSVLQQIKTEKMSSNIMCHFLSVVFCHLNATVSLSSLAALLVTRRRTGGGGGHQLLEWAFSRVRTYGLADTHFLQPFLLLNTFV